MKNYEKKYKELVAYLTKMKDMANGMADEMENKYLENKCKGWETTPYIQERALFFEIFAEIAAIEAE